ncbi:MAG TPA: tetratricopeptide repeat protein [Patescibacteria group bacterium]|nr:tetratricopeptide repeat protein [Patescibacteria group bacterium]
MWYYWIFATIIFLGIGVIVYVVARKFPQLARLDVENLPFEKEHRKKREILGKRIATREERLKKGIVGSLSPVRKWWGRFQLQFRIYVGRIERLWHHEERLKKRSHPEKEEVNEKKVEQLLGEGKRSLENTQLAEAEALFIAAIKADQHSTEAYRGLADTYLAQGALDEARQTYQFLLHLTPTDDMVMVKLADIAELQEKWDEAVFYYQQAAVVNDSLSPRFYHLAELLLKLGQPEVAREAIVQAVELEPKNPKYLDLLIETVILSGDKNAALQAYEELRMVNPDNQKLVSFKERISGM